MSDFVFSKHAQDMLSERNIAEEWVWRTIETPSSQKLGEDGNMHYIKPILEKDGRFLRVVINPNVDPQLIVTLFFDRRLRKQLGDES